MPPNPENILQEAMKRATDAWRSKDYVTAEREYNLVYSNGSESVQIGAGAMLGAIGLARGDPAQARPYLDEAYAHLNRLNPRTYSPESWRNYDNTRTLVEKWLADLARMEAELERREQAAEDPVDPPPMKRRGIA